jgi:hypothetical protein
MAVSISRSELTLKRCSHALIVALLHCVLIIECFYQQQQQYQDYISPRLTKMMIEHGQQACFKRDKKGYLPAHVACSRHCSPEKLLMLLAANPDSLTSRTNDGHSLLSLAMSTATKSHPNYALVSGC